MSTPLTLLAVVLALLALAAVGQGARMALAGAFERASEGEGVIVAHAPVTKEVVVGGRGASRSNVEFTRVSIEYSALGAKRMLHVDRAHEIAARDFPIGKRLPVFFRAKSADDASLQPAAFALFPVVLLAAGVALLLGAVVLFVLGRKT